MARKLDSAKDVADLAELKDVVHWEVAAKRVAADDQSNDQQNLEALIREESDEIGVRCRSTVSGKGGLYIADVEAVFGFPEEIELTDDALQEFVERVGLMVVYPFLRAAIFDGASRLALKRPLLRLMKPGQRLERLSEPTETAIADA
ncbi:hypothetical protein KXD97_00285 [Mycobacterium sp. SMC-8]|uniref:hypothetical protein n=1 Tax=Mycobacterium sp. SMC-8 TaxID=2857060 RepID=UPI0021B35502|nr:hypothetical protein [Mycobacterium sp. SMC-8]UXA12396.1 hypothetical protein KXD97_00285 [Mycobacterium sp. SMC-8]